MVAGPALDLSRWDDRKRDRAAEQEVTEFIMDEITKLLEGLRGEQAPPVRFQPPARDESEASIVPASPAEVVESSAQASAEAGE